MEYGNYVIPGDLAVMVSVRNLDEACPDVGEELLRGLVLGAVHLPSRHLADAILGPLEILIHKKELRESEAEIESFYLVGQISVII